MDNMNNSNEQFEDNKSKPMVETDGETSDVTNSSSKSGNHKWYIVNVYSTFENKVAEEINRQASKKGLSDYFEDIIVPVENVIEIKKGKKVNAQKKLLPGYILIKMHLTDSSWHLVRDIPRVTGFLGAKGKPESLSKKEVEKIMKQITEGVEKPKQTINFDVGEDIKITQGPFATFVGVVEVIDFEKEKLKVAVSIFGRSTPVELDFTQVEKIN